MSTNNVNLIGRLTRDPEKIQNGDNNFTAFTIAVDRMYSDETDFFNCTAWGKTGENIVKYLSKGRLISVNGRIENQRSKKDGETRVYPKIRVEKCSFLDSGNNNSNNNSNNNNSDEKQDNFDDFDEDLDDDLDDDFDVPF